MRALILVDIQNDFLPGGALAVPHGDEVIAVANALLPRFEVVVATQDWHPADHLSFAAQHPGRRPGEVIDLDGLSQILWPVHCVQGTRGAELAAPLDQQGLSAVFVKGTNPRIDSYSGFYDNGHRASTGLADWLRNHGPDEVDGVDEVDEVYVMGLATDYCVKFTALDAVAEGFATHLVGDGCRGVELAPGDVEAALAELRAAGVAIVNSPDVA